MSLRQLELFAALPDFATLSAAATHLHISESALSHAISNLEKTVGEQLCVRRKARGLTLTPAGQQFAKQASKILADTRELVLSARPGPELRGPVKLGCYTTFAANVVPELLAGFPARHPQVQIEITVGTNDELLSALRSGRLDAALVYNVSLPLGFRRREIYGTRLEVHLPANHPLASSRSVDLADLVDEPYIQYDAAPSTVNVTEAFAARGLQPRVEARVNQMDLVEALVARGLGYGLLMSRPHARTTSTEGRPIAIRPLDPPVTVSHVVALWPQEMTLSPRARALLDFAVEQLSDYATRQ